MIYLRLGNLINLIQRCARRLRRISRSREAAEAPSPADATSIGDYHHPILACVLGAPGTELSVDSTFLQALFTSLKEPEEQYDKADLAAIRKAFDDDKLSAAHWCPGSSLFADSLTKDNPPTADLLLGNMQTGKQSRPEQTRTNLGPPHM